MPTEDLTNLLAVKTTPAATLSRLEARISEGDRLAELPTAIPDDSQVWGSPDEQGVVLKLAKEAVDLQLASARSFTDALEKFAEDKSIHDAVETAALPGQVAGRLLRPDGTPGARLQIALDVTAAGSGASPTAFTADDGTFTIALPPALRSHKASDLGLIVTGNNAVEQRPNALASLAVNGLLPTVTLSSQLDPLSPSLLGVLSDLATHPDQRGATNDGHTNPTVSLGEDACELVFRKDTSVDKFPYGVLFRLTDPGLTMPTLTVSVGASAGQNNKPLLPVVGVNGPLALLQGNEQTPDLHLVNRVPVNHPLNLDAFRDALGGTRRGRFGGGVPIASTLALGYVVHMAQRWTPVGLALGDLVYSLPLAPGEQQKIAVIERTARSLVTESETLDTSEQMSFSERDDTSATATFSSAFNEQASGGSHYDADSSSFSVAAAVGGGGVFPFGCVAGGVATSYGTASASGNTNTWMSGSRAATSNAAQNTHSAVQRQASARRHSARTGMRLATSSETTNVVTKTIANHNKTRALTMQYWEVLRMFDVSTGVDGVSLVCLVPLDIIRFLPVGESATLFTTPADRNAVVYRYGEMIRHTDVLARVLPARFRSGLALLSELVNDPAATVAQSGGLAEDVMSVDISGSFLPTEDVYVTVVGKRGLRSGPYALAPTAPIAGIQDKTFSNETELFGELRRRRQSTSVILHATFPLPSSMPRQDVVGFEVSRRFRRLDYHFAPSGVQDLSIAKGLLGFAPADLNNALSAIIGRPSVSATFDGERLERELGGPGLSFFRAGVDNSIVFAQSNWGGASVSLPASPFPISSRTIPPQLGYAALLEIEKSFQWILRNTMTCSVAVYASLTPEERVVLLERYSIGVPTLAEGGPEESVPLLSCVTNNVLGYYGNAMVMPFMIPVEFAAKVKEKTGKDITTGMIQDSLMRFHVDGFEPPRSTIALPTKGVLGEAVLGHCPSAEKIDITRFWNWQDSPGDQAPDIAPINVPSNSLTAGLTAPSGLTQVTPMITNFNTSRVAADTGLATAIAAKAIELGKPFDIGALTNAGNLGTLVGKTLDTAESARKDALGSATKLAEKAMETAASISKPDPKPDPKPQPSPDPKAEPVPVPTFPGSDESRCLSIFFNLDKTDLVDATNEGQGTGQNAKLDSFVTGAKDAKATAISVRGFASPEGDAAHNATLAASRAATIKTALDSKLADPSIVVTVLAGRTLSGSTSDFPKLRRTDIFINI